MNLRQAENAKFSLHSNENRKQVPYTGIIVNRQNRMTVDYD